MRCPSVPGAVPGCDAGPQQDQPPLWLTRAEVSAQGTVPRGGALGCPVSPGWVLAHGTLPTPQRPWEGRERCGGCSTGCAGVSHAWSKAESLPERCERQATGFLRAASR